MSKSLNFTVRNNFSPPVIENVIMCHRLLIIVALGSTFNGTRTHFRHRHLKPAEVFSRKSAALSLLGCHQGEPHPDPVLGKTSVPLSSYC